MIDLPPTVVPGDLAARTRQMREKRRADAIAKYSQLLNRAANPLEGDVEMLEDVLKDAALGLTVEDFEADANALKSIAALEQKFTVKNSVAVEARKKQAEAVFDKALAAMESAKHDYQMAVMDVEDMDRDSAKLIEKIEAVKSANPRACGNFSGVA